MMPPPGSMKPDSGMAAEFPRFKDGDVAFVLSPTRIYHLHASTLRSNSCLLAKLLTPENAAVLDAATKKAGTTLRWRIELIRPDVPDPNSSFHHGRLGIRLLDEKCRPVGEPPGRYFRDLDAATIPSDEFIHWDNLLRCFYQLSANIRKDGGIGSVLKDVMKLADLAEYCGSMRCVALAIDTSLIRQGQVLYQSVARSPAAWAGLAERVRSEMVFREAVVHLVGQWPRLLQEASAEVAKLASGAKAHDDDTEDGGEVLTVLQGTEKMKSACNLIAALKPEIRNLCHKKHKILATAKQAIEQRLLSHYPRHLQRNGGDGKGLDPSKVPNVAAGSRTVRGLGHSVRTQNYGSDIVCWMALCLFRHFIGQMLSSDAGSRSLDGGRTFYQAIARGGDSYLDRDATEDFCTMFPFSSKSRSLFEEQLGLIKEDVRQYVADLVKSSLLLDFNMAGNSGITVDYLTCAIVRHNDMPWVISKRGGPEEQMPWPGEQPEPELGAEMLEVRLRDASFHVPGSTARAAGDEVSASIEDETVTVSPKRAKKRRQADEGPVAEDAEKATKKKKRAKGAGVAQVSERE